MSTRGGPRDNHPHGMIRGSERFFFFWQTITKQLLPHGDIEPTCHPRFPQPSALLGLLHWKIHVNNLLPRGYAWRRARNRPRPFVTGVFPSICHAKDGSPSLGVGVFTHRSLAFDINSWHRLIHPFAYRKDLVWKLQHGDKTHLLKCFLSYGKRRCKQSGVFSLGQSRQALRRCPFHTPMAPRRSAFDQKQNRTQQMPPGCLCSLTVLESSSNRGEMTSSACHHPHLLVTGWLPWVRSFGNSGIKIFQGSCLYHRVESWEHL